MTTPTQDTLTVANMAKRLKDPIPSFFKSLRKILVTVGAIGAAVVVATATLPVSLPAIIGTIAGYMVVAGAVGTGMAQLTSTQPLPTPTQDNSLNSQSK